MNEVSEAFADCWRAAGRHLQQQGQGALSWMRAHIHPPMLEHLSFRMGNQLFFVCIEAEGAAPFSEATASALQFVATGCRGHACVMPLRMTPRGWEAAGPGWGLFDYVTKRPIDPPALVTDEKIAMTEWELQDFAVQVVRDHLKEEGRELMSWQSHPEVDPSIWFVGDQGPEWVVVRVARYPQGASPPANWADIAQNCARLGNIGHFASVGVANEEDSFDSAVSAPLPLWRGHGMYVSYEGLIAGPGLGVRH